MDSITNPNKMKIYFKSCKVGIVHTYTEILGHMKTKEVVVPNFKKYEIFQQYKKVIRFHNTFIPINLKLL